MCDADSPNQPAELGPDPSRAFLDALQAALREGPSPLSAAQHALLARHFERLLAANQRMNLTRITEPAVAAVRHYADSLALLRIAKLADKPHVSVLDVGTGAGFPAVPLAVARPGWRITAIDSTDKKVRFVAQCAMELGLTNLTVLHARAEHWRPPQRFDVVALRAVAPLAVAIAKTCHLVAPRAWWVAYKSADLPAEEREAGLAAARQHRLTPAEPVVYELAEPTECRRHALWVLRKT